MRRSILRGAVWAGACVLVLLAVVVLRTLASSPSTREFVAAEPVDFDEDAALERLASALRISTIATEADCGPPTKQVSALRLHLQRAYPAVRSSVPVEVSGFGALLYRFEGLEPELDPVVLLAHLDVVPVQDETAWTHPPFSGVIADGFLWGRGALDDKAGACAQLEALEYLASRRERPRRTVYLAFGFDEEIGGECGAKGLAQQLEESLAGRGVHPAFVLDEGYAVLDGIVPVTEARVAAIGVAEKGLCSLELVVQSTGGHASMPPRATAIGILSEAIAAVQARPFAGGLEGPAGDFFERLTPHADFLPRAVLANRWLFGGLLERQLAAENSTNAILRTTVAATIFESGVADNVLPGEARAVLNLRLHPRDSVESAVQWVRASIDDPRVEVRLLEGSHEPSPVSAASGAGWDALELAIRQTFPDAIVAPSLVVAATDARWYTGLTPHVYRFRPYPLVPDDLARIHGVDERIRAEDYARMVRFYVALLRAL